MSGTYLVNSVWVADTTTVGQPIRANNGIVYTYTNGKSTDIWNKDGLYPSQEELMLTLADYCSISVREDANKSISLPNYPHSRCYIDEKFRLVLEFALAGYSKPDVNVTSNSVTITAKHPELKGKMIKNNISTKDIDFTLSFHKDYNPNLAECKFEGGILAVSIPRSETSEVKKLL